MSKSQTAWLLLSFTKINSYTVRSILRSQMKVIKNYSKHIFMNILWGDGDHHMKPQNLPPYD